MTSSRTASRLNRRLKISLGGRLPAITADVSRTGFCAELAPVFMPGSKIHGTIQLGRKSYPFKGEVAWAKPGNPNASVLSRIGVKFESVPDAVTEALS